MTARFLLESADGDGDKVPDLSFGTHFFHDLVETGIVYLAVYPEDPMVACDLDWIRSRPNLLASLAPESERFAPVVRVADTTGDRLTIWSDVEHRTVICYLAAARAASRPTGGRDAEGPGPDR